MLGVSVVLLATILVFYFGIIPTVWYFLFFNLLNMREHNDISVIALSNTTYILIYLYHCIAVWLSKLNKCFENYNTYLAPGDIRFGFTFKRPTNRGYSLCPIVLATRAQSLSRATRSGLEICNDGPLCGLKLAWWTLYVSSHGALCHALSA
jgi:hypothetical protein